MAGKSNRPERRAAPRVSVNVPGEIIDGPEAIALSSINLSANGILCETPRALPVFGRYRIEIEVPGGHRTNRTKRIAADAVVVRTEETAGGHHRAALFFERISADDRAVLERFVLEHLPAGSPHIA